MKRLRCDRQSILLLSMTALFGIANLVFLVAVIRITGAYVVMGLMTAVMAFYVFNAVRGTLEAFSVYTWDDEAVTRDHPLKKVRMRWNDVRDFRIQRSTGDASVFLTDDKGRQMRLDFQLLGDPGAALMDVMFRKLDHLLESKMEAIRRAPRVFRRRHAGVLPLAGSVTAGGGTIQMGTSPAVPLADVTGIAVKEVRKLTATQEYAVASPRGQVRFLSFVDDSPLLLRYLRSTVPEDRWSIARSSGVFAAKISSLILVPVMAWSALVTLAGESGNIATSRALAARSQTTPATIETVEQIDERRTQLGYSFDGPEGKMFGMVVAGPVALMPGSPLQIRYDPQQPWINAPLEGQGVDGPNVWSLLGPALAMLALSLPYAAATLAFKVRKDPFEDWIAASPPMTA